MLKDGASAVRLRRDRRRGELHHARELSGARSSPPDYGVSDRDDGERKGASFTFGHTSDRGSIMGGVNYNKYDAISANDRDFARDAVCLYSGYVTKLGSSHAQRPHLAAGRLCVTTAAPSVKKPGTSGTSRADYRCYTGADAYNYQPLNLVRPCTGSAPAPSCRATTSSRKASRSTRAWYNKTTSRYAIAPLPRRRQQRRRDHLGQLLQPVRRETGPGHQRQPAAHALYRPGQRIPATSPAPPDQASWAPRAASVTPTWTWDASSPRPLQPVALEPGLHY